MLIASIPYSRLTRWRNRFAAAWKWALSFRKGDWELEDYPIRFAKLEPDSAFRARQFPEHDYRASIINWAVMGSGMSTSEALESLRENFVALKQAGKQGGTPLVRPGSRQKIVFASQERVSAYENLSEDFTRRVLELEWAWISDESSLWDFHGELNNDALYARIREVYGVDVSDIESARLWAILERIDQSQRSSQS